MNKLYERKVRKDRWGNFTLLRHGAFDGMLCTSKNSGTHWVKYMLAIALAETYGIAPPQYFSEDAVRPYIAGPRTSRFFLSCRNWRLVIRSRISLPIGAGRGAWRDCRPMSCWCATR